MAVCTYMYNLGGMGMGIPVSLSVGIDDMLEKYILVLAVCTYMFNLIVTEPG